MSPLPVVLITGCSAVGIGFELARALAASGAARVIATARDVSKMNGLEASAAAAAKAKAGGSDGDGSDGGGGGILALLPLDVTDEASVAQAAAQVLQLTAGNGCDILVNNAGMTFKGTALDSAVAETARLFDTNVFGLMRSTQAFSRGMVLRGRGLVVNVGSATGYVHQVTKSSYSASKHAVRCLTDTLRVELAPFNVRGILVSPGYGATPIDDKAGKQGRWFGPRVGESPYAPPQAPSSSSSSSSSDAAARAKTGAAASSSSSEGEGFKEICTATASSIFKYGPGATAGAMTPRVFSEKLAAMLLREWKRTFPAKGRVTRPPTMMEYLASMTWLPTALGGPVRHWREVGEGRDFFLRAGSRSRKKKKNNSHRKKTLSLKTNKLKINKKQAPFASVTYFIGGFLPLWLQDVLLSWSGGLILKKSK